MRTAVAAAIIGCLFMAMHGCGGAGSVEPTDLGAPVNANEEVLVVYNPREIASGALGGIGAPAAPALAQVLSDADPSVRIEACKALAMMGPAAKEAVPALTAALGDDVIAVRQQAAIALGQIGNDAASAVPALIHMLRQEKTKVRP